MKSDWVDTFEDRHMDKHDETGIRAALVIIGALLTACLIAIGFLKFAGWIQ